MTLIMGNQSKSATPDNSDEESGDAFTDGDFGDSDEELQVERNDDSNTALIPVNETVNAEIMEIVRGARNGFDEHDHKVNGHKSSDSDLECRSNGELAMPDARRDSHGDQNPSIVGILGGQQDHVRIFIVTRPPHDPFRKNLRHPMTHNDVIDPLICFVISQLKKSLASHVST